MKKRFLSTFVFCCFALLLLNGCRTPLDEKPRNTPWTLSELENKAAGSDPIEPFNRTLFTVQHVIMEYPVDWIGRVYTSILPRPVIKCINNLCLNLEFPARFFSVLLRAEWRGAGHEFLRFLANSTLGIGGLFDVGQYWFGLYSTDSDFGQTFHTWGIDPGCTFILPFLPRVNVRDAAGFILDYAFDAKTYIPYSSVVMLNQAIVAQALYSGVVSGAGDPYKSYREAMVLRRELQNRLWMYKSGDRLKEFFVPVQKKTPPFKAPAGIRGEWCDLPEFGVSTPVVSTLRTVLWQPERRDDWWYMPLSIFNSDFANDMKKVYVPTAAGGEVTCGFWKAKALDRKSLGKVQPEPVLVVILPGVGGSCNGASTMALAELFHRKNCSVLTFDCAFSGSFMAQSRSGKLPGNVEYDGALLREVLLAAVKLLEEKELVEEAPRLILAGYSFGGLYTLKIADMEQKEPKLHIERFLAINPPVALAYASQVADDLATAGSKWSEKETFDLLAETAGKLLIARSLEEKNLKKGPFPLFETGEETGRFAAGLYFRLPLRHILFEAGRSGMKIPVKTPYKWGRRNKFYLELDKVSFKEYSERFVAPQFPGKSLAYLLKQGDLREFSGARKNPDVRVIQTWDDPLLAPEHRRWLDRNYGKRMIWFARGGHLGNMYLDKVKEKIVDTALK